jgi:hypothetical protein
LFCFCRIRLGSCPQDKGWAIPEQGLWSEEAPSSRARGAQFRQKRLYKGASTLTKFCMSGNCSTLRLFEAHKVAEEGVTLTSRGVADLSGIRPGGSAVMLSWRPRTTGKSAPNAEEITSMSAPNPRRAFLAALHDASAPTFAPSTIRSAQVIGGIPASGSTVLAHARKKMYSHTLARTRTES